MIDKFESKGMNKFSYVLEASLLSSAATATWANSYVVAALFWTANRSRIDMVRSGPETP